MKQHNTPNSANGATMNSSTQAPTTGSRAAFYVYGYTDSASGAVSGTGRVIIAKNKSEATKIFLYYFPQYCDSVTTKKATADKIALAEKLGKIIYNPAPTEERRAAFKEFYKTEKGAPEFLHNYAGFNFCAPYVLRKFNTPTTYRAIFDALNIPHRGDGWRVFAFYIDKSCIREYVRAVEVESIYNFLIDLKPYKYADRAPDYFYRKSDAESARKGCGVVWIVAQKDEHRTAPRGEKHNRDKIDPRERYNLRSVETCRTKTGERYINRLQLTDRKTGAALCYEWRANGYGINEVITPDNLAALIDKSGYITRTRRQSLRERAAALRAERKKAQADATDATRTAQELRETAESVKAEAARVFVAITTPQALRDFCSICGGWWSGLAGLFDDVEKFTEKATAKTFTSPEEIAQKAQSIKDKTRDIVEKLNALSAAGV